MPYPKWMKTLLFAACFYNLIWGAYTVLLPAHFFEWANIPKPYYLAFWQCIGMIIGVFGIGYGIAATNPYKHWPIVLLGLLGKIFGPIGFVFSLYQKTLPLEFGYTLLTNDLIWWLPFGMILKKTYDFYHPNSQHS